MYLKIFYDNMTLIQTIQISHSGSQEEYYLNQLNKIVESCNNNPSTTDLILFIENFKAINKQELDYFLWYIHQYSNVSCYIEMSQTEDLDCMSNLCFFIDGYYDKDGMLYKKNSKGIFEREDIK